MICFTAKTFSGKSCSPQPLAIADTSAMVSVCNPHGLILPRRAKVR